MKPSKSTIYVAIIISLLVSQCMVSGQGIYGQYRSQNIWNYLPILIGCSVGWLIGNYLACEHCHACSEENVNTEADCTEEEGCELGTHSGGSLICRCDESLIKILS